MTSASLFIPERFQESMKKAGESCTKQCVKMMSGSAISPCIEQCLMVQLDNLRHDEILRKLNNIEHRIMRAFGEGVAK